MEETYLLEETNEGIICGNYETTVRRHTGSEYKTKECAIIYYFKEKWYSIIVQFKRNKVQYYCNIATPYIIEEETVKYIDYDLDLRIYANKKHNVFDRNEFNYNKTQMEYPGKLVERIEKSLAELISDFKTGKEYFDDDLNREKLKKLKKNRESIDKKINL